MPPSKNIGPVSATGARQGETLARGAGAKRHRAGPNLGVTDGIAFSANESIGAGGFNESLSVDADAEGIHLRPLGMGMRQSSGRLTFEGAAEFYWEMFIDGLRR